MNDEEVIEKWSLVFGFGPDSMSHDLISEICWAMEGMTKSILTRDVPNEFIDVVVFPVLYRVMKGGVPIYDYLYLYDELESFMDINRGKIDELNVIGVDAEAQFIHLFCENYIENYKPTPITPIKNIKKWMK
jgi:hypothetical protein